MKLRALLTSVFLVVFALQLQSCRKATFESVDKSKSADGSGNLESGKGPGGTEIGGGPNGGGNMTPLTNKPVLIVETPVDTIKYGEGTTATPKIEGSPEKPDVTFKVSSPNNCQPGTIDPDTGVYKAPATGMVNCPVTITAVLKKDPTVTGTKIITVNTGKPELIATVPVAEIKTGGETTQATAKLKNDPTKVPNVTWTVKGPEGKEIGTIDPKTGVYTSPKTGNEKITVEITATLVEDPSVTATVPLIVVPAMMTKQELIVTVKDPEIKFGQMTTAMAAIKGGVMNPPVDWTVTAPPGKMPGTIDANGVYTAPATGTEQYPVIITAKLKSDPNVTGMTTVTVSPAAKPELMVTVQSPEVKYGGNKNQATATLKDGTKNPEVIWSVTAPAGKEAGTIDANGLYTSPKTGSEKYPVTITATLKADPSVKASVPVNLIPDDTVFARCKKANAVFPILAEVYQLNPNVQALPSNWSQQKHVTTVCMDRYAVAEREFTDGFPDVPGLFEFFGLNTKTSLVIPVSGTYTIRMNSDDGSKLWLNGQLIIDNDGNHPSQAKDVTIKIDAGTYPMVLDYFQGPRYKISLELMWKKPGDTNWSIIPKENFK